MNVTTEDDGFTLIEILIASMITAIILTVLTASFLVFFKNATYTTGRDDHAAGASVLAYWLDRDLASATDESAPVINSATKCASPTTLLSVSWNTYAAGALPDSVPTPTTKTHVDYQYVQDSVNPSLCMIQRVLFTAGVPGTPLTMVHSLTGANLSATASALPNGNCSGSATPLVVQQPLTVTLAQYHTATTSDDTTTGTYTYFGCLNARTNGLPTP